MQSEPRLSKEGTRAVMILHVGGGCGPVSVEFGSCTHVVGCQHVAAIVRIYGGNYECHGKAHVAW